MSKNVNSVFYSILSSDSTVTDVVGTRIYPGIGNQTAATPNVVIRTIVTFPVHDKDESRKDRALVQVSCYDSEGEYSGLSDLADLVRTSLDRKAAGTYGTVDIIDLRFEDQNEEYNDESKFHQIDQDYLLTYKR